MCLYEHAALETAVQLSAVIKEKGDSAVDIQLKMNNRLGFFVCVWFYFLFCGFVEFFWFVLFLHGCVHFRLPKVIYF